MLYVMHTGDVDSAEVSMMYLFDGHFKFARILHDEAQTLTHTYQTRLIGL